MSELWKIFGEKGKLATIIGLLLALPFNGKVLWTFFVTKEAMTVDELTVVAVMNAVAMVWFILPSRITLKAAKFELTVED